MTKKLFILIIACLLMINFIQSCETSNNKDKGVAMLTPPENTFPEDELLAKGQEIFKRYCDTCHPDGQQGVGPALKDREISEEKIRFQVRNGVGDMPAFPKQLISDDQLDALVHFLKETYVK